MQIFFQNVHYSCINMYMRIHNVNTSHLYEVAAVAKIASRTLRLSRNCRENLTVRSAVFGGFSRSRQSESRQFLDAYRLISVYKCIATKPKLARPIQGKKRDVPVLHTGLISCSTGTSIPQKGRESGLDLRGWKQGLNPRPFRHRPTCAMVKHALYQLSYPPR
jgi:hypothetical protein